jgi:hypothetical protein
MNGIFVRDDSQAPVPRARCLLQVEECDGSVLRVRILRVGRATELAGRASRSVNDGLLLVVALDGLLLVLLLLRPLSLTERVVVHPSWLLGDNSQIGHDLRVAVALAFGRAGHLLVLVVVLRLLETCCGCGAGRSPGHVLLLAGDGLGWSVERRAQLGTAAHLAIRFVCCALFDGLSHLTTSPGRQSREQLSGRPFSNTCNLGRV